MSDHRGKHEGKASGGTGVYANTWSYAGALIATGSILLIVFALALDASLGGVSPYIGIFTYMVFPAFFTVGALLFLYGGLRESRRRRRNPDLEEPHYPRLDLNDPVQRRRFSYVALGGLFLAILLAFVSYNAFLFTESVTFCGKICHTVMEPEHTAFQHSPHARVACVHCHVGTGASWYVRSKLSGARQVVAVVTGNYERPIPTPVENLRPARETCEECHWPQKFFGAQLLQVPHFRYDEKNSPEQVNLLVKTGGGSRQGGGASGIHWHMLIGNRVSFAAADRRHQVIPWVRVVRADNTTAEYVSLDAKEPKAVLAARPQHLVDCMDCHNRPTHDFPPAESAVDRAMEARTIPRDLPWIKKVAVDALIRDYPDVARARAGIRSAIEGFYRERYPGVLRSRAAEVTSAVGAVAAIYERSVFPKMRVNWRTYPLNIGHRNWPGCFRCHDGRHVDAAGKVLTRECAVCHTMPVRGPLMPLGAVLDNAGLHWHPWELRGRHGTAQCTRCHAAGYRPPTDCAECHRIDPGAPMMGQGCGYCHMQPQEAKPVRECRPCHRGLGGLHAGGGHADAACTGCHRPHAWVVTGRETCLACHEDRKDHNPGGACADCHGFRK